jgi:hypothetical protein
LMEEGRTTDGLGLKEEGRTKDGLEVTLGGESRNLGLGLENRNPKHTGPK